MDEFQRSWLLAELGLDTDSADMEARFFRLRSVRAVALDLEENLWGVERQIEQVRQAPAPDDPGGEDDDGVRL